MSWRNGAQGAARRGPGGAEALALITLASVVISGCVALRPQPGRSGLPATQPPAPASAGLSTVPTIDGTQAAPTPEGSPDQAPTSFPDLQPSSQSLATFTVVCEDWGGQVPPATIGCADAVALALAAIGAERATVVRRLDFWFGDGCDRGLSCAQRRPDVGWVVARSATFDTLGVRVALDPAGELRAWPPVPGPVQAPPTFTAPPRATPDLGTGLPAELRDRRPVPFCGTEDLTAPDAFETKARMCFLRGVLAGVPVELVSRSFSTEGRALLTLYRFTGQGAILRYVRTPAGWTGSACGISPIPTSAVFILAGTCDRLTL